MRSAKTKPKNNIAADVFAEYQQRYEQGLPIKNPQILLDQLTELQRKFVQEYMKHLNATKAVIDAGYNTKFPNRIATQLLHHERVKFVITVLQEDRAKKSTVSKDWVLRKLANIVTATEENNPQAALRGLELLGRHLGLYVDKTEITGANGDAIKYEKVEEDARDFTRSIAGLAERAGTGRVPLKVVGGSESQS